MTTTLIRLVNAKVTVDANAEAMAKAKEVFVTLRPDHECIVETCEDCHADLLDAAEAKLHTTVTAAAKVEVLRRRLATGSHSTPAERDAEAERVAWENETWRTGYGRSRNQFVPGGYLRKQAWHRRQVAKTKVSA